MEQSLEKIFITGANGFIGRVIAKSLADQGYKIVALVRQKKWQHKNIDFIEGDLINIDKITLDKNNFKVVVHLAAYLGMHEKSGRLYNGNLGITKKLLECFDGKNVHFIFFSSIEAFGPTTQKEVDEKDTPDPTSDYGKVKLKTEELVANSGLSYSILRIGNVSSDDRGLDLDIKKIVSGQGFYNKLQSFVFKKVISDYELSVIKLDDVLKAVLALIKVGPQNELYFLAGKPISLGEVIGLSGKRRSFFKILWPGLILFCKIFNTLRISHLICYIVSGGFSRKYRRYSDKKIEQHLGLKI